MTTPRTALKGIAQRAWPPSYPGPGSHPEYCEVQGPVRKAEPYPLELFGKRSWLIELMVVRGELGEDIALTLVASEAIVKETDLPAAGDDFGALIRMTGHIRMSNVRRQDVR